MGARSGRPIAIAVVLATAVFAAGANAATLPPCDGSWQIIPSPNVGSESNVLEGVASIPTRPRVWAVGSYKHADGFTRTLVEKWNGTAWEVVASPNAGAGDDVLLGVVALSPANAWAVGYSNNENYVGRTLILHWNGRSWAKVKTPRIGARGSYLDDIAAVSPTDIWAVGHSIANNYKNKALALHWNGLSWSVVPTPESREGRAFLDVARIPGTARVWAVGSRYNFALDDLRTLFMRWNGTAWKLVPSPDPWRTGERAIYGVRALSPTAAWAVGWAGDWGGPDLRADVFRWNGSAWREVAKLNRPPPLSDADYFRAVVPFSGSNVWAVGSSPNILTTTFAAHFDGGSWSIVPTPNVLNGADDENELRDATRQGSAVWAVGFYADSYTQEEVTYSGVRRTLVERYC